MNALERRYLLEVLERLEREGIAIDFGPFEGHRAFVFSIAFDRARIGVGNRATFEAIW